MLFVGAQKSSKSASRFSVTDLDAITVPKSTKKSTGSSPSTVPPKPVTTRGKGSKKRKATEQLEGLPLLQQQFEEYVSEVRIPDP